MYEHRRRRPLTARQFTLRMLRHGAYAVVLLGVSLAAGTGGYVVWGRQHVIDAFLNAAMLLGGMGPAEPVKDTAGKLFAAGFALYAGLVYVGVAGLLLAPVFHRILHRFHADADE